MGIITENYNGETHYQSMVDYVSRGNFHAAKSNDGQRIINGDTPKGYPTGYSVLSIHKSLVPELIACLTASLRLK